MGMLWLMVNSVWPVTAHLCHCAFPTIRDCISLNCESKQYFFPFSFFSYQGLVTASWQRTNTSLTNGLKHCPALLKTWLSVHLWLHSLIIFTMTVHCNTLSSKNATFLLACLIKIDSIFFTFSIYQKKITVINCDPKLKPPEDSNPQMKVHPFLLSVPHSLVACSYCLDSWSRLDKIFSFQCPIFTELVYRMCRGHAGWASDILKAISY